MTDLATLAIQIRTDGSGRAVSNLRNVARASQQTERAVDSLSIAVNALKRLMVLGIGVQGLSGFLQMADTMQSLRTQVQFVTGFLAELNKVQAELFEISQRTRSSLESTTQLYVRTSRALKDYGVSQRQVLQFTETINKAMAVGGVGAQEQASALMQLSQALGSGRLQGDEFKTIAETAPIILDVVAEYMGKSRAEVKKLASEGAITSKLLFEAINASTQKISKQFEGMPLTFGQAMQQMQNAAMQFVGDLNTTFGATNTLAQGVSFLAENFNTLGLIIGGVLLAHLAKFGTEMAAAALSSQRQKLANLEVARTAQVRAVAELQVARADMAVLEQELRLAQTEQARTAIQARMAQQASLIVGLTNAEAAATRNLSTAQSAASLSGRALSGVMGLLGGPAGVVTLAAGALFYFYQKSEEAKRAALDTAAANDRLKQSYEELSKAALFKVVDEQIHLLKESGEQLSSLKGQLASMQMPDSFSGQLSATAEEIQRVKNEIELMEEAMKTNTQVLEKQVHQLGLRFLASGETLTRFKEQMQIAGVSTDLLNKVLSTQEFQIASVKAEFQALFPHIDQSKISYDGLNVQIGAFSIKAELASIKALELSGALGAVVKGALMAAVAVANMNSSLGGGISDKAQKIIERNKKQAVIADHKKHGRTEQARQAQAELDAEGAGFEAGSADFTAVVESFKTLSTAQDSLSAHNKAMSESKKAAHKAASEAKKAAKEAKRYADEWVQYYDELHRSAADGLVRISLEQDRAMREMLDKAKKANIGYEEIEKAKTLIAERYAKERQAIAEKYAPELKHLRELQEQLKEIQQLEKNGNLSSVQAERARDNSRWETGNAVAQQAGQNAVSGYDRWKEQFDPMQAISNEQMAKTAELQSLYDQHLIQYQDFINAKALIDAKATADTQNLFMSSISGFGSAIDTMLGVMRNAGKEQSGIYKAMFAVSKAFAIADSIIKIQQGIANAAAQPYPMNLAAMATVASETASIISNIQSVSLSGMAHSGIDNVPREGTWLLDRGERVVDSRTNGDLKTFLKNQGNANYLNRKSSVNVKIINNGRPVNAKVDTEETSNGLALTVTLMKQMEGIANNVYSKRRMNEARSGGSLT